MNPSNMSTRINKCDKPPTTRQGNNFCETQHIRMYSHKRDQTFIITLRIKSSSMLGKLTSITKQGINGNNCKQIRK